MIFKQKMKINKFKKLKKFNMESTTMKKSVKTLIMKLIVLTIDIFTRDWLKKKTLLLSEKRELFQVSFYSKNFFSSISILFQVTLFTVNK
jgi:hypothetical protein